MVLKVKRIWAALNLEERILNAAAIVSLVSIFFPWLSGEWLGGDAVTYTGFSFYTSFIGIAIFVLFAALILLTFIPLIGGPIIVKRKHRDFVRFLLAVEATILLLAALSVLTKVTYEFSRIEIRFGIYITLIGSIVTDIYAFIRWQEFVKLGAQEVFHHPDDHLHVDKAESMIDLPPPPPPPPPMRPEEHHHLGR